MPKHQPLRACPTGFTLIEVLITVGIIIVLAALSLAGILAAKKHATSIRIGSDLQLIGTALEAYKNDCDGQYPVFADAVTDYNTKSTKGNGTWLDYSPNRGAVLLCRALLGPGQGLSNTTNNPPYSLPGDDGADGPGFRVRFNYNSSTNSLMGKVFGPYLDASKFKIGYATPPAGYASFPMAYPEILDINGNPILYYPAAPGNPNIAATDGYDFSYNPSTYSSGGAPNVSLYNAFDNSAIFPAVAFQTMMGDTNNNGSIDSTTTPPEQAKTTAPYLLWSAGIDGVFGMVNGKSDDVTNFQ